MADFKLFRVEHSAATEIVGRSAQVEKSLQILFEANLEALLGVRLLATEFETGKIHRDRFAWAGRERLPGHHRV